jgi:hypothetical protein
MAIVKKHIISTLDKLDKLYSTAPTAEAVYYSKLAVIEGCGWIELSMDYIAQDYAKKKLRLKTVPFQDMFKSVVGGNYGFQYKDNFRRMLIATVGLRNMEIVETRVNRNGNIDLLKTQLNNLLLDRNDASHTYIDATKTYPAPSLIKGQIQVIYPILKEINKEIQNLKT